VAGKALWKAHSDAEWEHASLHEQVDPMTELEVLSADDLDERHGTLIADFHRIAKLPA
jgi:hypothetical protein